MLFVLGVSFSFRFVFSLFVLLGVGVCCGCPRVCFFCVSFSSVVVPVGGVPGGSVVLLLCVLDGVSWRVLNGECAAWCVFVARLFLCDRGLVFLVAWTSHFCGVHVGGDSFLLVLFW